MRVHIIDPATNIVQNTIEVDSVEAANRLLPDAICTDSSSGEIGHIFNPVDGTFAAPHPLPLPVPSSISRAQLIVVLATHDHLEAVETLIAHSDNPTLVAAWPYVTEVYRDSPSTHTITAGMGWTSEYVDDLFRQAAVITL